MLMVHSCTELTEESIDIQLSLIQLSLQWILSCKRILYRLITVVIDRWNVNGSFLYRINWGIDWYTIKFNSTKSSMDIELQTDKTLVISITTVINR